MSSPDPGQPGQSAQPEQEQAAPAAAAALAGRQELVDSLTTALGDAVVGSEVTSADVWVRIRADAWLPAARHCRDQLGMDYFCFLSGIDWMPSSQPNPEEAAAETPIEGEEGEDAAAPEEAAAPDEAPAEAPTAEVPAADAAEGWRTGVAGGETRFQLLARLYSTTAKLGITLKADLDDGDPRVASWSPVYPGADWHERETWEMYGFHFEGHPNLAHLYLPGDFEGHPLRKDFPLLAREVKPWPGLVDVEPMPQEEPAPDAVAAEAVNATPAAEGGDG